MEICKHYKWEESKAQEYYNKLNNEYSNISRVGIKEYLKLQEIYKGIYLITYTINNAASEMIEIKKN